MGLAGAISARGGARVLLDRSKRRQVVATLRFWAAADSRTEMKHRKRIQQPWSLLLQLLSLLFLLIALAGPRLGPDDRVMLVRADALATPVTAFEADRKVLEDAIRLSQPGASALNLSQALEF